MSQPASSGHFPYSYPEFQNNVDVTLKSAILETAITRALYAPAPIAQHYPLACHQIGVVPTGLILRISFFSAKIALIGFIMSLTKKSQPNGVNG